MLELLCILSATAIGAMLAYRFAGLRGFAPRWASALLIFGTGTAIGIGIASIIFFVCRILAPGFSVLPILVEIALAWWLGLEIYRTRDRAQVAAQTRTFAWSGALALALVLVLGIGTLGMSSFWEANPQGNWDAWAIWNLRARFLASGGNLASRAWSPVLTGTHPEYPLLVSGFIARCWSYSGSMSALAPMATSYAFFLALVAMGTGGLAALEGGSLGLLFGLAVGSCPVVLYEVPTQYSDIPLACYFAGALILMLLERPIAAGLLASLAAWTKDEGQLFVAAFLVLMAITRRRQFPRALAGMIPVGILLLVFKLFVARSNSSLLAQSTMGAGLWPRLTDLSRYLTVVRIATRQLWDMRSGWYHPILPPLILAFALKFKTNWRRDVLPAGTLTVVMLAGYFWVYIITPNNLYWQVQGSIARLTAQLWPLGLIAIFAGLRAPEQTGQEVVIEVPQTKAGRSGKRNQPGGKAASQPRGRK
jgi:hypothetical protein